MTPKEILPLYLGQRYCFNGVLQPRPLSATNIALSDALTPNREIQLVLRPIKEIEEHELSSLYSSIHKSESKVNENILGAFHEELTSTMMFSFTLEIANHILIWLRSNGFDCDNLINQELAINAKEMRLCQQKIKTGK